MNRPKKTALRTLMGALLLLLLTGCEAQEEDLPTTSNISTKEQNTESVAASAAVSDAVNAMSNIVVGIEGWEPFEENVTIKIPVYDRHMEDVPDVTNNYWTDWIQKNFGDPYNITVEYVAINRTDVLNEYDRLVKAGEQPTIFMEYDYPKLAQWVKDGYLVELDFDEFMVVAPSYYQRMVDLGLLSYTSLDGKYYFALAQRPYYNTDYAYATIYRKDWLEQLGYDEYPDNWADEREMLLRVKESGICKYPCGGKAIAGSDVDRNYQYRSFPLDEENWACYGDYAIPALGDEANRKLLQRENEKYNLGLIEPNYDKIDEEKARKNFATGKCLYYQGYMAPDLDWVNDFYEHNPNGKLAVKVTKNVIDREGGTVPALRANNPFGMMIGFSAAASKEQIKAAWMYMEWLTQEENLFTMQWGIEGENFTLGRNGLPVQIADYDGECRQGYSNNKDYWTITIETRNAGSIEDIIAMVAPKNASQDLTSELVENYYGQLEAAEAGYAVSDCNFTVAFSSVSKYQATLLELYKEYRNELTKCDSKRFESLYDELAEQYAEAGYGDIVAERRKAYQAGQSTKLK